MAEGDGPEVDWLEDLADEIRRLHAYIIDQSGGVLGEHTPSLLGACARPFHTMFEQDLYPTAFERIAAFFHAIICDHVFADGNKRTATVASLSFMGAEGLLAEDEPSHLQVHLLGDLALMTAAEGLSVEVVTYWFRRIFDRDLLAPP